MEAWIEISLLCLISASVIVAPLVEAWIEIKCHDYSFLHPMLSLPSWKRGLKCAGVLELLKWDMSLPSRERGLKLTKPVRNFPLILVAPLVEAWIEISSVIGLARHHSCRSPRGSVD